MLLPRFSDSLSFPPSLQEETMKEDHTEQSVMDLFGEDIVEVIDKGE